MKIVDKIKKEYIKPIFEVERRLQFNGNRLLLISGGGIPTWHETLAAPKRIGQELWNTVVMLIQGPKVVKNQEIQEIPKNENAVKLFPNRYELRNKREIRVDISSRVELRKR